MKYSGPNKNKLDWSKRHKIIMGIADGLLYLHEICQRRIIHRDIKGENILLTENFEPQVFIIVIRENYFIKKSALTCQTWEHIYFEFFNFHIQ